MKSTCTPKKLSRSYPYLGRIKKGESVKINIIVLFLGPRNGTVVHEDEYCHGLGTTSNSWMEADFIPFDGTVTLSNDN